MKIYMEILVIMLLFHGIAFAADEKIIAMHIKKLPESALALLKPQLIKEERIVINSSAKWTYQGEEHFFVSVQYARDGGCIFFDVNVNSQLVKLLEGYQQCKIRGAIKFSDLNEDGYIDFFVPVRQHIFLPAPMYMNFNMGFVFNKEIAQYCFSNDAGYAMQDAEETNKKPKKRQFNDLRCL